MVIFDDLTNRYRRDAYWVGLGRKARAYFKYGDTMYGYTNDYLPNKVAFPPGDARMVPLFMRAQGYESKWEANKVVPTILNLSWPTISAALS